MINRETNELQIKPFLRPISKEEKEEVCSDCARFGNTLDIWVQAVKFLNETHCDYNGWIDKGLALPAPEGMYSLAEDSGSPSSNHYEHSFMDN